MLPKPEGCLGCPLYQDGKGFVPDRIPAGAEVLILAQNPGEGEEEGQRVVEYVGPKRHRTEPCEPQPMIGPTGYMMDKTFIPLAGLDREKVGVANVLRCRLIKDGKRTNNMPTGATYREATAHCTSAHLRIPPSVRLIIAQGAHAWRLLGGPFPKKTATNYKDDEAGGMSGWRGHLMPKRYGSAMVFGEDSPARPDVLATVHLAYLFKNAKMDLVTRKDWSKVPSILKGDWPKPIPPRVLLDAETFDLCQEWVEQAKKAPYIVLDTEYNEHTKHLILFGMGFLGMQFVFQVDWAHLAEDLHGFVLHWLHELAGTTPFVFQNAMADVPILRATFSLDWSDFLRLEDTMQAHAVLWCELPHDLEFQASVDGQYPKLKHLMHEDMALYNAGDVLETISSWEARLAEFARDPASRKVYDTQMRLLPHIDRAITVGIAVDKEKVAPAITKYEGRADAGEGLARAYCGWPINLRSPAHMKHWLYEVEGMPVQKHPKTKKVTVEADAIALLRGEYLPFDPKEEENPSAERTLSRIDQGGHPLLEAYILHARADHVLSHYLYPLVKKDAQDKPATSEMSPGAATPCEGLVQ